MATKLYKHQKNTKHDISYSVVHNNVNINFRKISPYDTVRIDIIALDITHESNRFHQRLEHGIPTNKSISNKLIFNTIRNTNTVKGIVTKAVLKNPKFLSTKKFYYYVLKESL